MCLCSCMHVIFLECHKSSVQVTLQEAAMALEVYESVTDKPMRQNFLDNFEKEIKHFDFTYFKQILKLLTEKI